MTKKHMKKSDGMYHINGKKYDMLVGSRAQVMHGTAYKTTGGLKKSGLKYNKHGGIVSTKKSNSNPLARLTKAGYFTKKGKFGSVKKDSKTRKAKGTRRKSKSKRKTPKSRGMFLNETRGPHGKFKKIN